MAGQIWVHSDWHRWHENIYRFEYVKPDGTKHRVRERFKDATEGDAYIEQAIRDRVKPHDTLLHLGDLCMMKKNHGGASFVKWIKSLPGTQWLVIGNHDQLYAKWYVEAGFQKIRSSHLIDGILFSHFPLHESTLYKAKLNAHGHIHQNPSPTPRHFNCCVEVNNYEPIPLEHIKAYADRLVCV